MGGGHIVLSSKDEALVLASEKLPSKQHTVNVSKQYTPRLRNGRAARFRASQIEHGGLPRTTVTM